MYKTFLRRVLQMVLAGIMMIENVKKTYSTMKENMNLVSHCNIGPYESKGEKQSNCNIHTKAKWQNADVAEKS